MKTAKIKITAAQRNLAEIANRGGAIMASEWTTGSGRRITRKATPAGCEEINLAYEDIGYHGQARASLRACKALVKYHPRVQKLIVVKDWRAANKAVKLLAAVRVQEKAVREIQRAANTAAAIRQTVKMATLPSDAATAEWFAAGMRHPAPAAVLSVKDASGLSWSLFESALRAPAPFIVPPSLPFLIAA